MKSLAESLLDNNLNTSFDKNIKVEIKEFLKQNYNGHSGCRISRQPNNNGKYEVSSTKNIEFKNKKITSLTNGTFIWTTIGGDFYCYDCPSLKSLEGAPKEVGGDFECWGSKSLKSLEGAPKEVGGDFYCYGCKVKFTADDIKKFSNVKGNIIC